MGLPNHICNGNSTVRDGSTPETRKTWCKSSFASYLALRHDDHYTQSIVLYSHSVYVEPELTTPIAGSLLPAGPNVRSHCINMLPGAALRLNFLVQALHSTRTDGGGFVP